jgi:hypothetical protein
MILDCFGKSHGNDMKSFAAQVSKIVNNNNGKTNVNLCVSSAPYDELPLHDPLTIPKEAKDSWKYVNRFAPQDELKFNNLLYALIEELNRRNLIPHVSWSLWQEPMAKRYYWSSFADFKKWTKLKSNFIQEIYGVFDLTNPVIYTPHANASLMLNPDHLGHRHWYDYMVNDPDKIFARPNHFPSTSFYHHCSAGDWNWNANSWPMLKNMQVVEYNLSADGKAEPQINSPLWTVKAVEFLRESYVRGYDIQSLYFFTLLDCAAGGSDGSMAAWEKVPGGQFVMKPQWNYIKELVSVIKDGFEVTATGIKGTAKEIVITGDNYIIKTV